MNFIQSQTSNTILALVLVVDSVDFSPDAYYQCTGEVYEP